MKNIFLILTAMLAPQNIQTMFKVFTRKIITPALALGVSHLVQKNQIFCTINDSDQAIIDKYMDRAEKLFEKIDTNHAIEYLTAEKKRDVILALIRMDREGLKKEGKAILPSEDSEAPFFTPILPVSLTEEEANKTVHERFAEKYIGELPSQISNVLDYFVNYEHCIKEKAEIHNRLLVYGRPGNGKTHLFQVLAQELQLPSLSFSASFFADKYIGVAARRINKAFETADALAKKMNKPVIIFIDEIDALAPQRKDNTHDENRKTLSSLLVEMQKNEKNNNVFIIAATNDFEVLDKAVKDRFSGAACEIKDLDRSNRTKLLLKIFKDRNLPQNPELAQRLADVMSYDFSNRDLDYIIKTAKMMQVVDSKKDSQNKDKHICHYIRKAMDDSGKKGSFGFFANKFSDGI